MFTRKSDPETLRKLRVQTFKASVVSVLYSLFNARKTQAKIRGGKFLLQDFAQVVGVDKSQASRWFSGDNPPNWQISKFYEACDALEGDVEVRIVDRLTGEIHTSHGVERSVTAPTFGASDQVVDLVITYAPNQAVLGFSENFERFGRPSPSFAIANFNQQIEGSVVTASS